MTTVAGSWTEHLIEQFDFIWRTQHLPRLERLTDDAYFWQPAPDCWTVHPIPGQGLDARLDFTMPPPDPAPVTTVAWRLTHVAAGCFGTRASQHFGDRSLTYDRLVHPVANAAAGVAYLREQYGRWREGVAALDDAGLATPVGPAEGPFAEHPMATLVLHINREAIHHLAEVSLLLDLYARRPGNLDISA